MAMLRISDIAVVVLLAIFLNLTVRTDQDRIQSRDLLADRIEERIVLTQRIRHRQCIRIAFPHKALIEGAPSGNVISPAFQLARHALSLLGIRHLFRRGGRLDQEQVTMRHQHLRIKFTQGEHRGISHLFEVVRILRKQVVIGQ